MKLKFHETHAAETIDLTDVQPLGCVFSHCTVVATAPNPHLMRGHNVYLFCTHVGDGWPDYMKVPERNWRSAL